VLLLYATGLYFSTQEMESHERLCISAHFLYDEKYVKALNKALSTLAQFFDVISGRSITLDGSAKESSLMHQCHSNKKHIYSQSNDNISLMAYLDSLEFVCKIQLQHTNAVWKNFSEGKAICSSGNLAYVLTALNQFIDSSLTAYR
jgi:separase